MRMFFMLFCICFVGGASAEEINANPTKSELADFLSSYEFVAEPKKERQEKEREYANYLSEYEDNETKQTVFQLLSASYGILPYKTNILMPITYDFANHIDNRRNAETFFQISFRKDLLYNFLGMRETFGIAYTQKSWWQTMKHSLPFRETNYLPEFYVYLPFWNESSTFKGYKFAFLHESNGQADPFSRSWNRLYAEGFFLLKGIFVNPRVWYYFKEKKDNDNPDILDYMGYGDLTLMYPHKRQLFKLMIRNNFNFDDNKGAVQFEWTLPVKDMFISLYYFDGYGESLIDYNQKSRRVGLGFALSR